MQEHARTQGYTVSGRHLCATTSNSLPIPPCDLGCSYKGDIPHVFHDATCGDSRCECPVDVRQESASMESNWQSGWLEHLTNIKQNTKIYCQSFIYYISMNVGKLILNQISTCLSHFGNLLLWLVPPRPPIQTTERGFQIRCWYLDWLLWQEFQFPI